MKITEYTREQIKQFVQDGICPVQTLRDYDLLKQIENGEKLVHVAMDNNMHRNSVRNIRNKYLPR